MHFVDFALSNSWEEYKEDCIKAKIPKKDIMDLLDFRMHVAKSLIYMNKSVNIKNVVVLRKIVEKIHPSNQENLVAVKEDQ